MLKLVLLFFTLLTLSAKVFAWGFFAHRLINYQAVYLLPPELLELYKSNIDYIAEHAVDPDKRRYAMAAEGPRHYIDLDHYGVPPFDTLPRTWQQAVGRFSEDSLQAHGIVPWWTQVMLASLTKAFQNHDRQKILQLSAELGHYIADAHVPLHTSSNHNGQLTGQQGIHGFWESTIPELLAEKEWDLVFPRAVYIKDPLDRVWSVVLASANATDSVLQFEKLLTTRTAAHQKFSFRARTGITSKQYSRSYTIAYNKLLGDMVERRLRESVITVASFWYTAWINAGQPDLTALVKNHEALFPIYYLCGPNNVYNNKIYTVIQLVHNFNSGPSILPREVFEEASRAILNFNDSGLSILELGHRTKWFKDVIEEVTSLLKELMELDDDHEVLFLHGGGSTQFMQVPMNLLNENEIAAFTDTGVWSSKAIHEAKLFGHVEVVCSSKDENYSYLPKDFTVPRTARYLHLTSNNTIYGTQWHDFSPFYNAGVPLVADMSSDILSRPLPYNNFDLVYFGAQKNAGAAGVTIVVVNKNILGKVDRPIPTMLDYQVHIANRSIYNTPPVFAVYVSMLTLRWLKSVGGPQAMESTNKRKADLLYATIDALPVFKGTVRKEDRSLMNIAFVTTNPSNEKEFAELCAKEGMIGVKGHRSTGGFRISNYNALPYESVEAVTDLMKDFAQRRS